MKFYPRWFGSLILVAAATAWPQSKNPQPPPPADNPELRQLFADDMHDRGSEPFEFDEHGKRLPEKQWKEASGDELSKHDAARRARVHEMLNAGTVRTVKDYTFASFIFQHGETPDDYLLAHVLGMIAASKGDKTGRWIAAATLDRYLQSIKRPQVFGTQFVPGPKGEITQGEYKNELLSNSVRAAMCVRPYEKQAAQVKQAHTKPEEADYNTGQFPCP